MFFRTPGFWYSRSAFSRAISTVFLPFSWVYAVLGMVRMAFKSSHRLSVPVVCVGNLVAGGAGKTPAVLALAKILQERGYRPHVVLRGYGGSFRGPIGVDPDVHSFQDVGDEALLLARIAPTWVARDRAAGARAAVGAGAEVILLDDGFQNPQLHKNFSFVVVDGVVGFGNARVIPAGPLREPLGQGLSRASAVIVTGGQMPPELQSAGIPVIRARLRPAPENESLRGKKAVAFAGIGRPEKFRSTLEEIGVDVVSWHPFADHRPYSRAEIRRLSDKAQRQQALLLTTEKDFLRLPRDCRSLAQTVPVALEWDNAQLVFNAIEPVLK